MCTYKHMTMVQYYIDLMVYKYFEYVWNQSLQIKISLKD